jgi:Holliday junction resolvase-like predicted endonuclease
MAKAKLTTWHVATAAEAIAAAQFARCGYDISVQYGANQPEYDLIVARGDKMMKVSVKGSQDGAWGLTQSFLRKANELSSKKANYHGAVDLWLAKHSNKTVFCLVQFQEVQLNELPKMYLATPTEISVELKKAAAGRGDTMLRVEHTWASRAHAKGTVDRIPKGWAFSEARIAALLTKVK